MFGGGVTGNEGFELRFVTYLASLESLKDQTDALARHLATGPTGAYDAP